MNNCQSTNLSGTSFKIVPRKSYIQLLEILKARLPESAPVSFYLNLTLREADNLKV